MDSCKHAVRLESCFARAGDVDLGDRGQQRGDVKLAAHGSLHTRTIL